MKETGDKTSKATPFLYTSEPLFWKCWTHPWKLNLLHTNNGDPGQFAHLYTLIGAFVIRSQESVIVQLVACKNKYLASPCSWSDCFEHFLSCVCYAFVHVCLFVPCGHLLGKGWPLGSRLWRLTLRLSLSHLYPGSGVVLDCIDPPHLLWQFT